jgi:hypothetical protein
VVPLDGVHVKVVTALTKLNLSNCPSSGDAGNWIVRADTVEPGSCIKSGVSADKVTVPEVAVLY